ncbi:MAG: hypothetical protein JNK12_24720 [Acidimicrobiales bacterium]|nr:hypothetical protein [Acidimicrobiales bacterium]
MGKRTDRIQGPGWNQVLSVLLVLVCSATGCGVLEDSEPGNPDPSISQELVEVEGIVTGTLRGEAVANSSSRLILACQAQSDGFRSQYAASLTPSAAGSDALFDELTESLRAHGIAIVTERELGSGGVEYRLSGQSFPLLDFFLVRGPQGSLDFEATPEHLAC